MTMAHRLSQLAPLAAIVAIFVGLTVAFAASSDASTAIGPEPAQAKDGAGDIAGACIVGTEDCVDTVGVGGPDIAPICAEGPVVDCVDTVDPGEPIADCQYDPCYDTPGIAPDPLGDDRCKQLADDLIACIADPDAPVSNEPSVKPAEPPDAGPVIEPYPGVPPEQQLAEDIAAREECEAAGAC
jgi:hypothetical protein